MRRSEIRKEFGKWLKGLAKAELAVLEDHFDEMAAELRETLKELVCKTVEFDYWHDPEIIRLRHREGEITWEERHELMPEASYGLAKPEERPRRGQLTTEEVAS